ncbi:Probable acyl-CoA dehydrogenase FadE [Mycobacteroides abscessus subsp. abscessus]|nr:Probable acyl-CoA dehydrogenase FadE [Mycobacteroides abscessus subsp. abscessus]
MPAMPKFGIRWAWRRSAASFRLLVLRTAWLIDKHQDYLKVRKDISAIKAAMPKVMHDVAQRALHLHGSLGVSEEMPLAKMFLYSEVMGLVDGPTEVHKVTIAKEVLKDYTPYEGLFPLTEKARAHVAARLEHRVGNL